MVTGLLVTQGVTWGGVWMSTRLFVAPWSIRQVMKIEPWLSQDEGSGRGQLKRRMADALIEASPSKGQGGRFRGSDLH
jgi:hypothetical protein